MRPKLLQIDTKVRRRAMRSVLAALLQSELTEFEIRQLADDLSWGSFGRELGEYIKDALLTLKDDREGDERPYELSGASVNEIQEIIARRRLSKKIVQQLMSSASPKFKLSQLPADFTVAELVQRFLDKATNGEIAAFISVLRGEPADAYLRGISRRDR